jgi:acetylornithine/succinyldiaminopimelate/putrescine aminotransferase
MLAMAAVTATLEMIQDDRLMAQAPVIFRQIADAVGAHVRAVRGKGCLIGLELDSPAAPVLTALREAGVLAGGSGDPNVIRLMPPLTTTDDEITLFANCFTSALRETASEQVV